MWVRIVLSLPFELEVENWRLTRWDLCINILNVSRLIPMKLHFF